MIPREGIHPDQPARERLPFPLIEIGVRHPAVPTGRSGRLARQQGFRPGPHDPSPRGAPLDPATHSAVCAWRPTRSPRCDDPVTLPDPSLWEVPGRVAASPAVSRPINRSRGSGLIVSVSPLPTCWRFSIRRSGLAPLPTSRSLRRTLFASTGSSSDAATADARGLAEIHRTFGDSHRTSPTKAEFSAASSTDQAGLAVFQASDAPRSAKTDARTSGRSVMIASTPRSRSRCISSGSSMVQTCTWIPRP